MLARVDREVAEAGLGYEEAASALGRANEEICAMLRKETDDLLAKTLDTASLKMRNAFAKEDA